MPTLNYERLLAEAIPLARKGSGWVEPNPRVAAMVIKDGEVVAQAYHREYGGAHAEVIALHAAGERARGADLFVTLEPCSTYGKTPPCTSAIIATGIRRVIYAIPDPNPKHEGKCRGLFEQAGIEVVELPFCEDAEALIADFKLYLRGKHPWCLLKWAMTADGKVATTAGDSRWISGEESRAEVHEERARCDGVMVGRVTVKTDDPMLSARPKDRELSDQPVRIVLDTTLRVDPSARIVTTAQEIPTWVIHAEGRANPERRALLETQGVRLIEVPMADLGRLDLEAALVRLREEGLHRILVEGGPTVHGAMVSQGLARWARVYIAPLLIGGITAPGPVAGAGFPTIEDGVWLQDVNLRVRGSDLVMDGRVERGFAP